MKSTNTKKQNRGMSLIEILIVVSVFAILGILTSRSVLTTLRGARKSDSQIKVKENVNYAFSVMERQLRSAYEIDCPNTDTTTIDFISLEGITTSFSCVSTPGDSYIASGSARLTSTDISVDSCSIVCEKESENSPAKVSVSVVATDSISQGPDEGSVSVETEIVGRNY